MKDKLDNIFSNRAIPVTCRSDGEDDEPNQPTGEIHDEIIYDGVIYDQENTMEEEGELVDVMLSLSIAEDSVGEIMLVNQEDDIEVNGLEEMVLPTEEEFTNNVKSNVLTSTDPSESLADRLDKISSPSLRLTVSLSESLSLTASF